MNTAETIFRELKSRLERGVYAPGSRFPAESQLADEFSVNKMTMNKVVSLLAAQKFLIRGVRGAGTRVADLHCFPRGVIAFLSPLTPYAVRVLRGVYAEALRHNFAVVTESPAVGELQDRLQLLKNMGAAGVISATYGVPRLPEGMALVCVDSEPRPVPPGARVCFINSDNFMGGVKMMSEILRRGHREILIVGTERFRGAPDAPETPRIRGFHRAMTENGITDCAARTFYCAPDSLPDARNFLRSSLKKFPRTTLIAADSDGCADLIHTAALQLNVECPGQIALTGFGRVTPLPIADVDQNPGRQGELAARHLIRYAAAGVYDAPFCEEVETSLSGVEHIPILLNAP